MSQLLDEKYYEVVKGGSASERLLIRARDQIYSDFLTRMKPEATDTIVDIGISDVINDGANVLERKYPYQNKITACGLGEAPEFRNEFPQCSYRQMEANKRLSFADKSFDIATSNAVLEHVGSFENQHFFIRELCRVAHRVFLSVPHRYFPIEHHTSIPFLHYNDSTFKLACAVSGKSEWCAEENLMLMTRKRLWQLVGGIDRSIAVGYTGLRLGPLSSNLFVAIT